MTGSEPDSIDTDSTGTTLTRQAVDAPADATGPAGVPAFPASDAAGVDVTGPSPRPGSTAPTSRQVWTRVRGLLLAAVVVLVAGITLAAVRSGAEHGRLDPGSADPLGSRALAALLADRDVSVRTVTTADEARSAVGPDTTLLVAGPDLLTHRQQTQLHAAAEDSAGRTVLVAPGPGTTDTLAPDVTADPAPSIDSTLAPGCGLAAARRAGSADTGGIRYTTSSADADSCYFSDGLPTLVRTQSANGAGDTVVLGAPDILYNDRLDERGNASLALQLLGTRPHVVWYLPSLSDTAATDTGTRTFYDLIPSGWLWGALQLTVAVVLAALWRARRLGPLVTERIPVVIRASETAEGRARLYRRADARDRAAAALRAATRTRLAPLVGTPPAHAHAPESLLPALSARLHAQQHAPAPAAKTPAGPPPGAAPGGEQSLHALLFGPPPRDDAALIALADQLDALEGEVRRS